MSKKEFNDVFNECNIYLSNINEATSNLKECEDKDGKIDGITFAYVESIQQSTKLIYDVLSKILDIDE